MKEIKSIIDAYEEAWRKGLQTALATVVHVDGSSYRRPGARMLITEDGLLTGAISGGCLEGDALRKALHVMIEQKARLVTYDTTDEDDAKFGVGIGCNGIIQVLIEPIDHGAPVTAIALLKEAVAQRSKAVVVTLFSINNRKDEQPGTCFLIKETNDLMGEPPFLHDLLLSDGIGVLNGSQSAFKNYNSEGRNITAFIEYMQPPVSLIVVGAGNDVFPLIEMADILGWQTTVVDGRPSLAKKERFTSSCQVLVSKPESVLEKILIDEQTVFLLMTHNYNYDLAMLRALINKKVSYIGSLGPRKKLERMFNELLDEGLKISPQMQQNIFGPTGLDIGAETPEEIALSILAEIKAVLSRKNGGSLKLQTEVIHPRSATAIQKININL